MCGGYVGIAKQGVVSFCDCFFDSRELLSGLKCSWVCGWVSMRLVVRHGDGYFCALFIVKTMM